MLRLRHRLAALLAVQCSVLALLPLSVAAAAESDPQPANVVIDEEDEDNESGFGIRLPWWGSKDKAEEKAAAKADESSTAPENLVIIDEEDEDGESGFGIPIRFPGDKASREKDRQEGYEPVDPETYRVVIDEEDEDNESGFGIPLPTEDNPTPWRKRIDSDSDDE